MEKKYILSLLHYFLYYGNFFSFYLILYILFKKYIYPFFLILYNQRNIHKNLLLENIQKQKKTNIITKYEYQKKSKALSFYKIKILNYLTIKKDKINIINIKETKNNTIAINHIFFKENQSLIEDSIKKNYYGYNDFSFSSLFFTLNKEK